MEDKIKEVVDLMRKNEVSLKDLKAYLNMFTHGQCSVRVLKVYATANGVTLWSKVKDGPISVGMKFMVVNEDEGLPIECKCVGLSCHNLNCKSCPANEYVSIKVEGVSSDDVKPFAKLVLKRPNHELTQKFCMLIDDVLDIKGTVVTGKVAMGSLSVGNELVLMNDHVAFKCKCVAIEKNRKLYDSCRKGERVAIKLEALDKIIISKGMKLVVLEHSI